jgi:hypothetical protein
MPMRQDCKFFESRTYANGETVRKCDLDLAPEAPWRCPENCPMFTRRIADVNWSHGSLVTPGTPPEPESLGDDPSIAALLDEAESIVNAAGPWVMADLDSERRKRHGGTLSRMSRKIPGLGRGDKQARKPKGQAGRPKGEGWGERLRRRYRGGR